MNHNLGLSEGFDGQTASYMVEMDMGNNDQSDISGGDAEGFQSPFKGSPFVPVTRIYKDKPLVSRD